MKTKEKLLNFKTNVLLKSIIGKDLINDDNIAILELVKNSYDAGSPTVDVQFKNLKNNDDQTNIEYGQRSSKILIRDFGKGMNGEDIENKWLNIAYSEKKNRKEDNNRVLAGNKGVGRFSCDRLGQYLDLYTRTTNDKKYFHLKINWNDFETETRDDLSEQQKEKLEIQKIKVLLNEIPESEFETLAKHKPFKQGVILEISKLRSQWAYKEVKKKKEYWNVDKLLKLRNYLEKLINPNQSFQNTSFTINLDAAEFSKDNRAVSGFVKNKIFDKLEFTATNIESFIDGTGEKIFTSINDKGRVIFMLEERNSQFKLLKNIRIILYYLNTYSKIYFAKQTGIRSVDFGSVFLFINGFMIPPYGEVENDWLGLEIRRGQGHSRFLSTRELVGRIEIKDSNNNFKIISSREGVVNDEYFQELTQSTDIKKNKKDGYFYYTFKRLEKYVVQGLNWDKVTGEEDLEENETLSKKRAKVIKDFESKVDSLPLVEAQKFETYYETESQKKQRIFSIIQNIIDVKRENIIDLYINEDLILELAKEEEDKARENIRKLLDDIGNLQSADISQQLKRIEENKASLENIIGTLDNISQNTTNEKTLYAINTTKKLYTDFNQSYISFKQTAEKLSIEKQLAEERAIKEEEERKRLEAELEIERQKNVYLLATRRTLSDDADGLIHTIKINSIDIRDGIDNLISGITSSMYDEKEVLKKLGNIRLNAEKSLKMSEIATRSNFKEDIEKRSVDIVQYFIQYLSVYSDTYSPRISFEFVENEAKLIKIVSILNLSIIIDNVISNSLKWGANKAKISFKNIDSNTLSIIISDNGIGLSERFLDNPERIFELGVNDIPPSKVSGSGIGLYYTRELLKDMYGRIKFIGNGEDLAGAAFEIILKKPI
ncbi:ATP-binding protein [Terrimonas alba]|uniref:ATP-binding protein n=1 Tax=Terrimonas alba TaxID=3349636 RepID=UPI0035F21E03